MVATRFKRYRMQCDLRRQLSEPPPIHPGYLVLPWRADLLESHAAAKWASFANELDALVFSCLADAKSCLQLMRDIVNRSNFAPQATWLLVRETGPGQSPQPCGTIQGIFDPLRVGSLQNVGVAPRDRGMGLGSVLLHRALSGFQQADQVAATLEVTARNTAALRLYQRVGFAITHTVYRSAELALDA
jgi:hypothetical protein